MIIDIKLNSEEENLKLEQCISHSKKYRCNLTKELDDLSGISKQDFYDKFYHYVLADDSCKKEKRLAIRVPGRTIGDIRFDDNNIITKIVVDLDYVAKTYSSNMNELIQKFVGEVIDW